MKKKTVSKSPDIAIKGIDKISRKEAIKKVGKVTALTAATLLFLETKESAAASPADPGWGGGL